MRQVLFIQGAGAGVHDEWDCHLVASLARELGAEYEVRYPRMPQEDAPSRAAWCPAIRCALAGLEEGAVVVGHSVGATLLLHALTTEPRQDHLAGLVLLGAPFVGEGGWPSGDIDLSGDLGSRLPPGLAVHVFHGVLDQTVPSWHAESHCRVIDQAQLHLLPGRNHQLGQDLAEVAQVICSDPGSSGRRRDSDVSDR